MKRFFCVMVMLFFASNILADDRFDIWRDKEGKKGVVEGVVFGQPSYEIDEGKRCVESLTPVPAVECEATGFGTFEFANENSKGQPIRCRFNPSKSAIVFVDGTGEPLYIKGCRDGSFCNRIRVIRKKVPKVVEVERVPYPPPRAVCEERFPEPEARVCLDIPEVRPCLPEIYDRPVFLEERRGPVYIRERFIPRCEERYPPPVRCRPLPPPPNCEGGRPRQISSPNLNCGGRNPQMERRNIPPPPRGGVCVRR